MKKFKCKECGKIYDVKPEACECEGVEFEEIDVDGGSSGDPKKPPAMSKKEVRGLIAEAVKEATAALKTQYETEIKDLKTQLDLVGLDEAAKTKRLKELEDDETKAKLADYDLMKAKEASRVVLADRSISSVFADFLTVVGDAEATLKNIDAFEKTYRADIAKSVSEAFKDNPPGAGGAGDGDNPFAKKDVNITDLGVLFKKDPEKARRLAKEAGFKL